MNFNFYPLSQLFSAYYCHQYYAIACYSIDISVATCLKQFAILDEI